MFEFINEIENLLKYISGMMYLGKRLEVLALSSSPRPQNDLAY